MSGITITDKTAMNGLSRPNLKLLNSFQRAGAIANWAQALPDDAGLEFWDLVISEWPGFDLIPHTDFSELFTRFLNDRPVITGLHGPVRVYRGQDALSEIDLAWTTDILVARGFAKGHRGLINPNPVVYMLNVLPSSIAFRIDDRQECEVVSVELTHALLASIEVLE